MPTRIAALLCMFLLAAATTGCGSSGSGRRSPRDGGTDASITVDASMPDLVPPYPEPPYGQNIGDTLAPFSAPGYRLSPMQTDSTTLTYGDYSIKEMHTHPDCRCLVISIGAEWCSPCRAEQPVYIDAADQDHAFCPVMVMLENSSGAPANQATIDRWTQAYHNNFPVVAQSSQSRQALPTPSVLPTTLIIDPRTMQILNIDEGFSMSDVGRAKALCGI